MVRLRVIMVAVLTCGLVLSSTPPMLSAFFDIGSGGQPNMSGDMGGSVIANSNLLADLAVTINFGELSPINTNQIVKVVVPIAIRSSSPYQVTVSITSATGSDPNSVKLSDIGFGIQNMRPIGQEAQICNNSQHIIYPPFNNDPSQTMTIDSSGRASYQSSLANIVGSTLIMSGPQLSKKGLRRTDNAWAFDTIFVVAPGFYTPGSFTVTLTFTISAGPNVPC
jgi:hypothetical protein